MVRTRGATSPSCSEPSVDSTRGGPRGEGWDRATTASAATATAPTTIILRLLRATAALMFEGAASIGQGQMSRPEGARRLDRAGCGTGIGAAALTRFAADGTRLIGLTRNTGAAGGLGLPHIAPVGRRDLPHPRHLGTPCGSGGGPVQQCQNFGSRASGSDWEK
jgi:hypothetical protein